VNRILFGILAVLLILNIFVSGCTGYRLYLAPIHDIDIWADNSLPPQYFLYVVLGEPTTCSKFDSYNVTRAGNTTIIVEIFNLRSIGGPCGEIYGYDEHTIPLGSDFIPGGNYMVEINDVTVNFVAGVIMIYPALILSIEIRADESLPPQYFVDVVSEEPTTCDHFDSYNVTRAGNTTILVEIFNRRCCTGCPDPDEMYDYNYAWHTIPLGSDFVPGGNYTVEVNDVTETFVAQ
jgi:hypothetical protein